MKYDFPIYEFRPIYTDRPLLRYNDGNWIEDDGEYDLCFITADRAGAPMCYYVSLPYRKNILWSWAKDGNWGASVSRHPDSNAWHYMSKDGSKDINDSWNRDKHPNKLASEIGMSKLSKEHSCANGSGVDFHIGDPYILVGLVREKKSKKVVVFPKEFKCIYCGSHDVFTEDKRLKKYLPA